ncbi:MAG: helix-turn-helix transcriptional regulator [Cupriavidus sp.]|nr:helix-turn-helix transcriptional regulator [Cupriavidus sp.]
MLKKSHKDAPCPMARGVERVGDPWSILILREAFYGSTRFDEFQKRLGIAPNMLTRRLNTLVEAGMMTRRQYSAHPPRDDYVLTDRGHDFRPVLLTLLAWGIRHFAPEGEILRLVDRQSGNTVQLALVDSATGKPITEADHYIAPGPAASAGLRARLEQASRAKHTDTSTSASATGAI